jgi:hypothetical protein
MLHIGEHTPHRRLESIGGAGCEMRRERQVIEPNERTVRWQRFHGEHIHGRSRDHLAAQRIGQILLDHDAAARCIDQHGCLLHAGKSGSIEEVRGFGRQRAIERDHIGLRDDLLDAGGDDAQRLLLGQGQAGTLGVKHTAAETLEQPCECLADGTQPHDAHGLL